ncbi:4Fe-4S dicluster domain-containing protein [uncultured Alsobacter sp.]|uniref:4Fe-4S dicluster domain-containing protein n=1 Tax=uncultured Alsobacter sp. TaxID=1748258 RepID=UPI0025E100E2|nr:4Fe-4S dicluster domain-containing protein [uncultured Alsobacter sp.]
MDPALSRRALFRAVLPRPAQQPDAVPPARVARIGAGCVEPAGVSCRRCGEACDTSAITFAPLGGGRTMPRLAADRCTGCGDCASVCPVSAIALADAEATALIRGLAHLGDQDPCTR